MGSKIVFSVIIPTYNRADFITKTLDSFLNQTCQDFEIIIVDDGSTDNTNEVVKPYLSDRIFYYKKKNEERAAARNYGAEKARGEYVNFFDSDDLALNNHLIEGVDIITKNSYPTVFHLNYVVKDLEGNLVSESTAIYDVKKQIIEGNPFSCNGIFIRKDIALSNPFNALRDLSASEDYELWLRLIAQYTIICSPVITSVVIQHENRSITAMKDPTKLINRFSTFIEISSNNELTKRLLGSRLNYFKMRNYLLLSVDLASNNFKKLSFKYLLKACSFNMSFCTKRTFYAILKHLILPKSS